MARYYLAAQYDARASFYNKAVVEVDNYTQKLYSYKTLVAQIVGGNLELFSRWDSSATTLRHVKEFLKQNGFKADTLEQMRKDYEA